MKTPEIDQSIKNLVVGSLGASKDVSNGTYEAKSTVIRIAAIEESRIKTSDEDAGCLFPVGAIEYLRVIPSTKIKVEGSVNIMDCL